MSTRPADRTAEAPKRCALAAWRYDEVINGTAEHDCECGGTTQSIFVLQDPPDKRHYDIVICARSGRDL